MAKKDKKQADFAVIKTGGKQYLVSQGEEILVDRLSEKKGAKISFETLLKKNKSNLKIGNPILKTDVVKGEVIQEVKDEKVIIFKYKPKKRYRKKTGFRAKKTKIKILSI
jgi:large subunit ribosomal protein L21